MAKHNLYDKTPKMEHDEHGKVHVKKEEHKEGKEHKEKGVKDEGFPMHVRHAMERMSMHHQHESEHHMHDHHHEGADKKEMHERHKSDLKSLHTKHEKEMGATGGSTQGEPIEKIEKETKHG